MHSYSRLSKAIAHSLITVIWMQPLLSLAADLQLDPKASTNARITQAGNGVAVIHIAKPNAKGLSHNTFTHYNVDQQGLILNNSSDKFTPTQLGGIILGNSQLQGQPAQLILNEVNGGRSSQLQGYTEVAGKQAHVVVANPHGITCDGCGFINTPHATLTTGKPIIEQGDLSRYEVGDGQIEINGAGLNASNISQFDLITRSAKLNADLYANELAVITGRNSVDAPSLVATAKTDQSADTLSVAIDSSALGGMYAGAIRLVGTEAGVGVRLAGDMAASAGDIQINTQGQLSLAHTAAKGDIRLDATQINLTQGLYSAGAVQAIASSGGIHLQENVAAAEKVHLEAALIHNQGVIEAGLQLDGSRHPNTALTLQGGEFKNQGLVVAQGALQADLKVLNNQKGQMLALEAGQITADYIDNSGGEILGQETLELQTLKLDNAQGTLASTQALNIQASEQLNNSQSGLILSQGGELNISSQSVNNQAGVLQAERIKVAAATVLDNQQGQIFATQGDLQLASADMHNDAGTLLSQRGLRVAGTSLSNQGGLIGGRNIKVNLTGRLDNNAAGLIEASDQLALNAGSLNNKAGHLRALGTAGQSVFRIKTLFNNDKGVLEIANQHFLLNSQGLSNQQGIVHHLGDQFALDLQDMGQAGGRFLTHGVLKLDLERWLNTSEIQAQKIELKVDHLTNTGSGILRSLDDLEAWGTTWLNDGQIESNGALQLSLTDSYQGKGVLQSQGDLSLTSQSINLQPGARLLSADNAMFELGGQFLNAGTLLAAGTLQILSSELDNQGTLGAGQQLDIDAADILNQGLILSGGDMALRGDRLSNRSADIYALGALTVAKDEADTAMSLLENRSGSIESGADMYLHAAIFNNRKEQFRLDKQWTSGQIDVVCYDCSGDHHNVDYLATEQFEFVVAEDSAAARIHSGGDLVVQGGDLTNHYSSLSARGDLSIFADRLDNKAANTGRAQRVQRFNTGRITDGTDKRFRRNYIAPYNFEQTPKTLPSELSRWRLISDIETQTTTGVAAPALIQAGGDVQIQAGETINNAAILSADMPQTGQVQIENVQFEPSIQPVLVQLNPQLPADLIQNRVDPTALSGFALPQTQSGLFKPNFNAEHPYLIETSSLLNTVSGLINSNYLLQGLGYNPEQAQKRLGDGLYEQRLIEQAVLARTGRHLLSGLGSNEEQFRYLMDNAIADKKSLNLSLGVSLTAEQMAALTQDIVWLEEREVQGQTVWVPILYLAQVADRVAPTGALIQGRNLALSSASDLSNSGTLRAQSGVAMQADNITNSGLIQADKDLQLLAQDSIYNQRGGLIDGGDVHLLAVSGDISNERSLTQETRSGQGFSQTQSIMDKASGIAAANDLFLLAGRDIMHLGAHLKGGAAVDLHAGGNLLLVAAQATHGQMRQDKRHTWNTNRITQHGAEVQAGAALHMSAGQNIALVASQLQAGGDMHLHAGADLLISSAANAENNEYRYRRSGKKINQKNTEVRQQASVLEAGGDFIAESGIDTQIISSQIKAEKEASLIAGGKLQLLAEQDYDHVVYKKNKKGSFGRKSVKHDEDTQITHVGSSVSSGSDLTLFSGSEQRYQAAILDSAADLTLDSGDGIVFEGVKDLKQKSRIRSKSNWAWQHANGKGYIDETFIQSQLQAQGEIAIRAAEKIQIDIKEVNPQSISRIIEAIVQVDSQLAWLKEVERLSNVDWRHVQELHESFKYSSAGFGGPAAMAVAIVVSYYTAGTVSGVLSNTAGAVTGSGSAMAASGTATASAIANGATVGSTVAAGWANATFTGTLAGAAGGAASAVSQGQDWRKSALIGGVTGSFVGYLSAGTYYNNPIHTLGKIKSYIGSSEWMSLGKEVSKLGMNQVFGYGLSKVAKELGLQPYELNWLLMAGSIIGNQWTRVGSRFSKDDDDFLKTNGVGVKGVGNRENQALGVPFDIIDIALGYQGLPDASVQDYLSQTGTSNALSSGHSLGTETNIYLASNGLVEKTYLYSVPFGLVAPVNSKVMIGNWDIVNFGWFGKLLNWDAKVVPIKPWEHSFENYKKYINK